MRRIVFRILATIVLVVIFNQVLKQSRKKVILLRKNMFRTKFNQLVNHRSTEIIALRSIRNKLTHAIK